MRPSNIYNESIRKEIQNMIAENGGGGGGSTGREVPSVKSSDNGKVLKATYSEGKGSYSWDDETVELPSHTSSNRGQFLGVNKSNDNLGWKEISQVPETTGASQGDVLTVGADGVEWATPSGGLPTIRDSDRGKALLVNPYSNTLIWSKLNGVPNYAGASNEAVLTVEGSYGDNYLVWRTPPKTQFATLDGTPTERTNDVLYTFNLPTLYAKARYKTESFEQTFYEDVIVPFNTQIGVDNKTVVINFTNMPSGYKLDTIEVILEGFDTTNYTKESLIDNINVDMGNFIITTKVKTSDMFGTSMNYLKIRGLNSYESL